MLRFSMRGQIRDKSWTHCIIHKEIQIQAILLSKFVWFMHIFLPIRAESGL